MKKLLLLSFLSMTFAMNSFSQDKATDLKRLFELMHTDKMIDGVMNNMIPALKKQAGEMIQGEDAKEKFDKYIEFMMGETKALTHKLVDEEMAQIYDKHFTHEDIKAYIVFYESSAGKKMLEKIPEITKDLMDAMTTKYLPEFQEKLTKKLNELK